MFSSGIKRDQWCMKWVKQFGQCGLLAFLFIRGESQFDFHTQCVIMTLGLSGGYGDYP